MKQQARYRCNGGHELDEEQINTSYTEINSHSIVGMNYRAGEGSPGGEFVIRLLVCEVIVKGVIWVVILQGLVCRVAGNAELAGVGPSKWHVWGPRTGSLSSLE
jgi:hypothetical protein